MEHYEQRAMTESMLDTRSPPYYRRAAVLLLIFSALLVYAFIPDSRMYWPYMASAYILALFVYMREVEGLPAEKSRSLLGYLFPKEVWFHPSALHDCVVALVNFVLLAWVFDYVMINPGAFQALTKLILASLHISSIQAGPAPGAGVIALYTLVSLLLSELFYYISHRLTHTVPMLWEFHKVHHSAEVMTPLTLYRMHPADLWFNMICRNIGLGLAAGVFLFFYPDIKGVIAVAGVNVGIFLTNVLGANLRHSHIWLRFGSFIEHFVLSPAQHQIHHSVQKKHFDKNYGSFLSLWDWAFGSLYIPEGKENITFGLGDPKMEAPYQSLRGLFLHPFKQFAK